jgi:hypothetical protein
MIGWMINKDGSTHEVVDNFIGMSMIFPQYQALPPFSYTYIRKHFKGVFTIGLDLGGGEIEFIRFAEEVDTL